MTFRRLVLAAALALAPPAFAHENKGPNGGKVVDAGPHHIELVTQGADVSVFITDGNDRPLPAAGFKGTAVLLADGKPQRIALEPQGARLTGKAAAALPSAPKGAVQFTDPKGQSAQGKF